MYIPTKLDKSTEVTNHITTTLLPSTHFAEVTLVQGLRGLTPPPLFGALEKKIERNNILLPVSPGFKTLPTALLSHIKVRRNPTLRT